jgi:hypothetical protein
MYELSLSVVAYTLLMLHCIESVRWFWWIKAASIVGLAIFINEGIDRIIRGMPLGGGLGLLFCYALAVLLALDICQELDTRETR